MTTYTHSRQPDKNPVRWATPYLTELERSLHEALHAYAVAYLREKGGTREEAIVAANDACTTIMVRTWCRNRQWVDQKAARRLALDTRAIQAEVTARICTGERLWITGGEGRRWHRVATPTRALCGAAINHGSKAWVVRPKPSGEQCVRCAKMHPGR